LTQLAKKLERIVNLTMRVTDWHGDVVFLHEIVQGAADRSYGIQVAKLAGLPAQVVERARRLLAELEASDRRMPVEQRVADLPLFAASQAEPEKTAKTTTATKTTLAPAPHDGRLGEALDALDPDSLTPRAALEAIYKLKKLRGKGQTGRSK
jgi:DNA mismatch repair protein MutS